MEDSLDLQRFVTAQDAHGTYEGALREIRSARKTGHWMWFVFPQIAGLGRSATAQRYALSSLPEAQAYLAHPVLGHRLREASQALLALPDSDPERVFGSIDAMKLRSSMTLFARADPSEEAFGEILRRYFGGEDGTTLDRLGPADSAALTKLP